MSDHHEGGCGHPVAPTNGNPRQIQAEDRNDHRAAGHDDRRAGGGFRVSDGLGGIPCRRRADPDAGRQGRGRSRPPRLGRAAWLRWGSVVGMFCHRVGSRPKQENPVADAEYRGQQEVIAAASTEPNMSSSRIRARPKAHALGLEVVRLLTDLARAGAVFDLEACSLRAGCHGGVQSHRDTHGRGTPARHRKRSARRRWCRPSTPNGELGVVQRIGRRDDVEAACRETRHGSR